MVVETSQFRVKPGISVEKLLAASQEAQDGFLAKRWGYLGRDLLRAEDGGWLDIVRFKSLADAEAAMQEFASHPSTKAFADAIDPATVQTRHYELAKRY